jgi:hypothetical protein
MGRHTARDLSTGLPAFAGMAFIATLFISSSALAGPWNRDPGHFYINLNYSRIVAGAYFDRALQPNQVSGRTLTPGGRYLQHGMGLYGEVGIVKRWLMGLLEWNVLRYSSIDPASDDPTPRPSGSTLGVGDLRIGVQSGLLERGAHLAASLVLGIPVGDPRPVANNEGISHSGRGLPLGSGDVNLQLSIALGEGFSFWVIQGFAIFSMGMRLRDLGRRCGSDCPDATEPPPEPIAHELLGGGELGFKIAKRHIDRLTLIFRMSGQLSLASEASLSNVRAPYSGLGNGVSFLAYGGVADIVIYKGLHAGLQVDSAIAARYVPAGINIKPYVSYEW